MPTSGQRLTHASPSASIIPNLPVGEDVAARIRQLVFRSLGVGRKDEAQDAVAAARSAAAWYVNAKVYDVGMPGFRRMILPAKGGLRDAVQALMDKLPSTSAPVPFAQLRSLFCYGDPEANGNEEEPFEDLTADQRQHALKEQFAREDEWDQKFQPIVVKRALEQWLSLMDELSDHIPPTKVPKSAELNFVSGLHSFWTKRLNLPAENTRTNGVQSGAFADFVRIAAEIIPADVVPDRQENWDHQLRQVLEGGITL
jgi:hypothetical protein